MRPLAQRLPNNSQHSAVLGSISFEHIYIYIQLPSAAIWVASSYLRWSLCLTLFLYMYASILNVADSALYRICSLTLVNHLFEMNFVLANSTVHVIGRLDRGRNRLI